MARRGAGGGETGRSLEDREQEKVNGEFGGGDVGVVSHVAVARRVEKYVKDELHVARVHLEVFLCILVPR